MESHNAKLEEARAELAACESTLKSEERALVGVKRRIFREALRMRMRAMAQLADVWRSTADKSMQILDSLEPGIDGGSMSMCYRSAIPSYPSLTKSSSITADLRLGNQQQQQFQPAPVPSQAPQSLAPTTPSTRFRDSRTMDGSVIFQSPEGSVIAPSHSASQMARKAAGYPDDYSEYGYEDEGSRTHESRMLGATAPIQEENEEERGGSSDEGGVDGLDAKRFQVHVNKPLKPAEIAEQKARERAEKAAAAERASQPTASQMPFPTQQNGSTTSPGDTSARTLQPMATAPQVQVSSANTTPRATQFGEDAGLLVNGASRKRVSSAPAPGTTSAAATAPRRETAEERQQRFAALQTGSAAGSYGDLATPPLALPSATQYSLDAHKKRTAPEATLFLPSSDTRTTSYRVTQDDSDEELDEVGQLRSHAGSRSARGGSRRGKSEDNESVDGSSRFGGSTSRKLHTARVPKSNAVYQRSDAGESTVGGRTEKGGDKRHSKIRSETEHKGFMGALTGLFKKRDITASQRYVDDDDETPQTSPRIRKNSGASKKSSAKRDDGSDSDVPNRKSLVKVYNTNIGRPAPTSVDWAALDTRSAPRVIPTSRSWVPPPERERQKAMSDVGMPRSATTSAIKRKSSVKSTAAAPASVDGTTTVKKKKRAATISSSPYDAGAAVALATSAHLRGTTGTVLQTPAQRVTRTTPSLMSVVAPSSQPSATAGMHLPSAKNPAASATTTGPATLGTLPAPSAEPLKKKKTVKKSSTSANIAGGNAGLTPSSAATPLRTSATSPALTASALKPATRPSSILAPPKPPASILSVGSNSSERRKSVRLASDTKLGEASYPNAGGPAQINGVNTATPYVSEWATRNSQQDDVSSDEEGDAYARIRAQLSKSSRDWEQAGFVDKGKGRAY